MTYLEALQAGSPRILLVDDDAFLADTLKDILEEKGYVIQTAGTAKEALDALQMGVFNLMIVDFQLPDGKGSELAEQVRQRQPLPDILMMSGHAEFQSADGSSLPPSISDYLAKPVNPDTLTHIINRLLDAQRKRLEVTS